MVSKLSDSNLRIQKYSELSTISMKNYVLKKKKKNFVCRDLLNPILIFINLSIKTPLIGAMKFNSCIFKTKIYFKTFFKYTYRIKLVA